MVVTIITDLLVKLVAHTEAFLSIPFLRKRKKNKDKSKELCSCQLQTTFAVGLHKSIGDIKGKKAWRRCAHVYLDLRIGLIGY